MLGITKTAIFANSKGGVGKSTLAVLMGLGLATRSGRDKIELIDLDPQATSSDSLKRFTNHRFSVVQDNDFFLGNGFPNNAKITNHVQSKEHFRDINNYIIIDSPAGSHPVRSSFFMNSNIIFVPTSVSDADLFATRKFLDALHQLFEENQASNGPKPPPVVILPTMVDSREEFNEMRTAFSDVPAYFGRALYYSPLFRRAFRAEANDENVKMLLRESSDYTLWLTNLMIHSHQIHVQPNKLFQL